MIVSEVMTTKVITIRPDDTLGHAANVMRQHQFHHLPVVRTVPATGMAKTKQIVRILEGLLTSEDIDLAVAVAEQPASSSESSQRWQEQRVSEVMHPASVRVDPTTSLAAASQILVERGLNCLPVVEYADAEEYEPNTEQSRQETRAILVGLLTRSDLLIALARATGAYEPGMQLTLPLQQDDLTPLIRLLQLTMELHIPVHSLIAAPRSPGASRTVTLRLGTIHPASLLLRLQQEAIPYTFADPALGGV